jgi:hypothetical protein
MYAEYCWAISLSQQDSVVRIEGKPLPELFLSTEMLRAAGRGNVEVVKQLLSVGEPVNAILRNTGE